ncbi:unnamed protein product [Rhizophagus irregularis]|uniref:T6SS Phospholipase effector Tle1-like catalytic domain-containing protein n=1 Tax=Rhizophagus irregularis TaxID=588596 RepID=A0A2N1NAZ0_9GLOM|nr:hypothetical protein RhiirC2_865837 [Rhizophagus irregularis]CAB4393301.1 unnamed protein product [Rhizophagus irregularis]CAB5366809.1 unnamed protein product [Rhizophagus irregularis]
MGKNIVVLCDGTWNSPNSKSNIYLLYKELLERDYQQHVLYIDGIGVGEMAFGFIIDGAIALSLDAKIKKGYEYIITHYNPGDDIWLFGFSRGAYTVRCIAGMIRNCGILKIDQDITSDQIDKRVNLAYEIYRDRDVIYHPEGSGSDNFKKAFSYPDSEKPIIKFLGLWDTVGAYGIPAYIIGEGFKYLEFYDQTIPNIVNFACQALATHERISFFEPCRIFPNSSGTVTIKETWFPGIHIEIGGGTVSKFGGNERISKATILWMIENIEQIGGLLMRDNIETYRTRFSPDFGPSWNVKNLIFDHSSSLMPTFMLRDRVIPLELDSSQKFLRKDLIYRDSNWLIPFGSRSHLSIHYASNTYEKLRKVMETKGIRLYKNVRYDKDVNRKAHL